MSSLHPDGRAADTRAAGGQAPQAAQAPQGPQAPRGRLARALLRHLPLIGTLFGLAVAGWLVTTNDLSAIGETFARVGWVGLLGVVLVRLVNNLLCGIAWHAILDGLSPVGTGAYVVLRYVREGINVLLPVASVGGDVLGARLLTFWGVGGALAAASMLADMLIQVGTQVLYTLIGVVLLMQVEGEAAASLARWMLNAILVAALLLVGFFAVQRTGLAGLAQRALADLVRRFAREEPARAREPAGSVQAALDRVWARDRTGKLFLSVVLHLLAWILGAAESWIALSCIGIEIGLTEVFVLESLAQAIKSVAFPVPSGLGVQEGGFVVVGTLFGLDPGTAIALSLVKRVPDVVLGLPALIYWQALEARRAPLLSGSRRE